MKSFNLFCGVLACIGIYSCTRNQVTGDGKIIFEHTSNLVASDSVEIEKEYGIFNPVYMAASNDSIWIVVGDESSELVCLLDGSGKCVSKGVLMGKGPGEVLEITSIHHVAGRTMLYDARKGEISELLCVDGKLFPSPLVSRMYLQDDAFVLPDGRVLSMPVMGEYSYALLDESGNIVDSLSYYPPKPEGVSDFTHSLACTGTAALIADRGRFARTLAYDGAIDFFGLEGGMLNHVSRQEEFGMDYIVVDVGQPVPTLSETTRMGYGSLTASEDLFYALFSDEPAQDNDDGYREIHIFTSDGLPSCNYRLDRKLSNIAVKPDNSVIYGIGTAEDERTVLYIYDIRK